MAGRGVPSHSGQADPTSVLLTETTDHIDHRSTDFMVRVNVDMTNSDMRNVKEPVHGLLWSRRERHQWMRNLFVGGMLLYTARSVAPVCAVQLSSELHWDRRFTGTMLGSFFWGYMCTQFLGGYLSDQLGGEQVVTMAAFFWGTVCLLTPLLPSLSSDPSYQVSRLCGSFDDTVQKQTSVFEYHHTSTYMYFEFNPTWRCYKSMKTTLFFADRTCTSLMVE